MFRFLQLQWKMRNIDEQYLQEQVTKGRITQKQMEEILATEQVPLN